MPIQLNNTGQTTTYLSAPTSGSWALTLPTALGTSGQYLTTNGSGVLSYTSPSTTTITGFTTAINITAPNTVINVSSIAGTAASTDVGIAIVPKSLNSGLLACIPDGTTYGGDARGVQFVDLQFPGQRTSSTNVVKGQQNAILGGYGNEISSVSIQNVIMGGLSNRIIDNAFRSVIAGGYGNLIGGTGGSNVILGGRYNTITTTTTGGVLGLGGRGGTNHGTTLMAFFSSSNFGQDAIKGMAQTRFFVVGAAPTSTSFLDMTTDPTFGVATVTNSPVLPEGYVMLCRGIVSGYKTTSLGLANWNTMALFKRPTGSNISLVGSTVTAKGTFGTVTNFLVQWSARTTTQSGVLIARANSGVVRYTAYLNILDIKAP